MGRASQDMYKYLSYRNMFAHKFYRNGPFIELQMMFLVVTYMRGIVESLTEFVVTADVRLAVSRLFIWMTEPDCPELREVRLNRMISVLQYVTIQSEC